MAHIQRFMRFISNSFPASITGAFLLVSFRLFFPPTDAYINTHSETENEKKKNSFTGTRVKFTRGLVHALLCWLKKEIRILIKLRDLAVKVQEKDTDCS